MIFENAPQPLTLPTHEGSGQATHPSVVDFLVEHNMESWGGYRYWMAMTPYPFTNDAHEDPNLIASNDNVNWVVPSGIVNPLADAPGNGAEFHNDPDMIYNPDTNELWIYYRLSASSYQYVQLIKVSENMEQSEPITVISLAPFTQETNKTRSMCIWRESSTSWHMWGSGGVRPYKNYYYHSEDGINWTQPIQVFNEAGNDPFHDINYEVWHMSCKPNSKENRIEFMTYCYAINSGTNRLAKIYHSYSMMHTPHTMIVDETPVLSAGTSGSWDFSFLYRCSFVIENSHGGVKYHLWYSARGADGVWGIGYTSYPLTEVPVDPEIPIDPEVPRDNGVYWHEIKSSSADGVKVDGIKVNLGYWHGVSGVFIKR